MGKLYVAFHRLLAKEMPEGTIDPQVRAVVTCLIVHSAVKMAYQIYSDPESEEKTPEEYADGHVARLMDMPPEQWWHEIIIFPPEADEAHQGLIDCLPEEHPPLP